MRAKYMNTRNWNGVDCVFRQKDGSKWSFKDIIEEMEAEAKQAKKDSEDKIKGSSEAKGFFLLDWINRVRYSKEVIDEARLKSDIKEQKLNLLYQIITTTAAKVSMEEFNKIVNGELNGWTAVRKEAVLNARTSTILNELYKAIGGEQNGFFPPDLQDHIRQRVEAQIETHRYGHH
jgi:hypothetical protein